MEDNLTLSEFKAHQRKQMNEAIRSGKPVNPITGFVENKGHDRTALRYRERKYKLRINKK